MPDYPDVVEIFPESVLAKRTGDCGYDIVASSGPKINYENKYIEYETNFRFAPESDFVHALLLPRSSISNYWLTLCNSVALIDSSFRGRVLARFRYLGDLNNINFDKIYKKSDKILQCVFLEEKRVYLIENELLNETERGSGSFGSTGL